MPRHTPPPWHCKVFGKLPAKEREKLIRDNQLCLFCLLHDKDKPCGAKQRPVACSAANCKGRHIQKLHDFLKDVFRDESQVHVVHGDDEWEESEEAWELGEEEMMIVGTIQQEDDCKSWWEQNEKEEVGVYQVRAGQGASGAPLGAGGGAAMSPPAREQEGTKAAENGWWAPGLDDLLIEGEEGEYFLKLLMREASPGEINSASGEMNQPAGNKENSKSKTVPAKGNGKKKGKTKSPKGGKEATTQPGKEKNGIQKAGESVASQAGKQGAVMAPDPLTNPEAKGRGLIGSSQTAKGPGARPTTTSRGECSGQEKPDS
jgi:hypothetical protein